MKVNKIGTSFLIIHTLIVAWLCWLHYTHVDPNVGEGGGMHLFVFQMKYDQLALLVTTLLGLIPGMENIIDDNHKGRFVMFSIIFIFGGIQWYFIGSVVRMIFQRSFWTNKPKVVK